MDGLQDGPAPPVGEQAVTLAPAISRSALRVWRIVQVAVWLVGVAIVLALMLEPALGIHAFWNVLIPVAPALLVISPGLWRNICPLGSTALFPRHARFAGGRRISSAWQGHLALVGVVLLLAIVPLRHVVLDTDGPATAIVLLALAGLALAAGLVFEGKSGWCSGICPVHPVERLYGQAALVTPRNVHCGTCTRCVGACPEAIPAGHPLSVDDSTSRALAGVVLVGGFPGFIYGWFQVRDYVGDGWEHLGEAYGAPFAGLGVTLTAFLVLRVLLGPTRRRALVRVFAAAAVAAYYWFRIPALFGFGVFPGDGMLVDLSDMLPTWFPLASSVVSTLLFAYLLVGRSRCRATWTHRPPFAITSPSGDASTAPKPSR